jgi:hypothetical protein
MNSVERQNDHHDEVGNQDGKIEAVPAVEPAEGVVAIVGVQVVAKPFGGQKQRQRRTWQIIEKRVQKKTPRR